MDRLGIPFSSAFCFLIETFLGVKILYQVREKADFAVSLVSGLHLERKTRLLQYFPSCVSSVQFNKKRVEQLCTTLCFMGDKSEKQ